MEIPVKKNEEYIVEIVDNGYEGEGIAKIENYAIFIPGAIKGEKVKIIIVKVATSYAFGKLVEIIEKADCRVEADCNTYKRCGGCNLRHIDYNATLKIKKNIVQNLVNKSLDTKIDVKDVIGMETPYNYRNKAQYPIGLNSKNEVVTGVYANRTHEIIPINNCRIQSKISEEITRFICNFIQKNNISIYNEKAGKGLFRHVVVKVGFKSNEVMCVLVINGQKFSKEDELIEKLTQKFDNIKTIVKNINTRNTNVILGNSNITLFGEGYIYDQLGEYTFKISPMSFYQINPVQTEILYTMAIEKAELSKNDIALDLYCGIGTIGIFAAKYVKQVYGIEIVEQAIIDAKENARINKIDNINFYSGDVELILKDLMEQENIAPNVVFVDPPRKGLDTNTITNILNVEPEKVIYISCNPATLTRDLKFFEDKYEIREIQPVDMFPFTNHVETIAVINLK